MNILNTIIANLRSAPNTPILTEIRDGKRVTTLAGDVLTLIAKARHQLAEWGVKPGDRIGLLAPNSARWVATDLAILSMGAICVPLYARQDPDELASMLRDCTPTLLVVATHELKQSMKTAWPEAPKLTTFDELFAPDERVTAAFDMHEAAAEDLVTIIYTSGTSGEPKGVLYNWTNVDFMVPVTAERLDELTALAKREPGRDKVFHYLPFCFAGSRIVLWTCLYRNNPLMMSTDLNVLKDELAVADPNYFLNVPTLLERVRRGVEDAVAKQGGLGQKLYERGHTAAMKLRHGTGTLSDRLFAGIAGKMVFPKIKRKIGPSLEFLICGSAPLSEETQAWFEMIGIPVYQVYGLTETTAIVTMDLPDAVAPGRVGFAVPGVEAKLGEEDELLCRGPNICSGYWNRPDATSEAIVDGWFHTGDQCEVDAAGNWRIVGRVKNLLVPESGHNVAPEPLEQKVREACSAVEQAVVVGHGRPFLSVIVTGNVAQNQIATALERVNKELPHYRRLRKFHHSEELFTPENGLLTANQKMKRGVIEKHFSVAINRMYA